MQIKNPFRGLSLRSKSNVDLSAANNPFGTIAGNQIGLGGQWGFVPSDGEGGIIDLINGGGNVKAQWLGLSSRNMQFWAYNYCSPLAGVIDRLAEADSNGIVQFVNEDDNTLIKNPNKNLKLARIRSLLRNPNPEQTWEEFDSEQIVLCKIFGYCPVFAIGMTGYNMDKSYCSALVNLSPYFCLPQYNYEFDLYSPAGATSNRIKQWTITILGKSYTIPASDILLVKDGFIDSSQTPGLPLSKIAGLDYFVSNICAAMEADNVLLKKKGPLGVFSYDAKPDMAGWTPMSTKAKEEIQNDLKQYGMTWAQLQYIISKTPIKWNSMSFNVQELMTKDTVRQGIEGICDRFGYPAELMSGKNATYENRNSAEKFLYQNNIIPFSLRRMARYNSFFGLTDGKVLRMNYNHLPVLQEDILKAGQSRLANSEALQIDWISGMISYNEYRIGIQLDEIPGKDDFYYPDWVKENPEVPANVVNVSTDVKPKANAKAA